MPMKYTPEGWPDHTGNHGHLKDRGKSGRDFTIIEEIRKPQYDNPHKVIYLQQVKFDNGKEELRLCYYIIGKIGRTKGKWVFGQFAILLSAGDLREIIAAAKAKGWI